MAKPIRLIVCGAAGRVGSKVAELAERGRRFRLEGAVYHKVRAAGGVPWMSAEDLESLMPRADVVVDFTLPKPALAFAALAAEHRVPFVTGVTGLSPAQTAALKRHARRTAVFHAPNMSLGMNVMLHLSGLAAGLLPDFDAAIVEAHHKAKRDAPSGTALRLKERVPRASVAAVRAGGIVGEHTLYLAGAQERVELTHRAQSRGVFAEGALTAAAWLVGREPGLYGFEQMLGLAGSRR